MNDDPVKGLERRLGVRFSDTDLLRRALLHRSWLAEHQEERSNERLEFLGDAVLQLAVTTYLFAEHPELPEGELAKVRASIVNERALAGMARDFDVGRALFLGRGEETTGGRDKPSILADAMEAIIGAMYLDGGLERAEDLVLEALGPLIADRVREPGARDYKTRLQEHLAQSGAMFEYVMAEQGPDHAKTFTALVVVDGREIGRGEGTSKKRAQQAAARVALATIDPDA